MCAHFLGLWSAITESPLSCLSSTLLQEHLVCQITAAPRIIGISMRSAALESECRHRTSSRGHSVTLIYQLSLTTVEILLPIAQQGLDICVQSVKSRRAAIGEDGVKLRKTESVAANQETNMCAHIACFCSAPIGEEYCSDSCREAGSDGVEVACECDHPACPVTARQFTPSMVA